MRYQKHYLAPPCIEQSRRDLQDLELKNVQTLNL